jgi:hypothetical protein
MQGLPTLSAPAYAAVLPAQSPSNRAPASANRYRYTSIAAAATGVSVIALLIAFASHPEREHAHLHSETLAMTATPVVSDPMTSDPMASDPMASDMPPAIATLVVRSQDLESKLRRMPSRPIVERAGTTTIIDSLQTSIQWVDYKLSLASDAGLSEQQAAQLWRDRIQLMDSLVKVRYAETQRVAVL